VSGWFLQLCYGLHTKNSCGIEQIKLNSFKVPVEVKYEVTNESKTCYVAGGFHGVDSRDERHKPVMSLAIIDDTSTNEPLDIFLSNVGAEKTVPRRRSRWSFRNSWILRHILCVRSSDF
jgi:hypothetical protein